MSDRIVVGKGAQEFFRELVTDALSHRRLRIQEATEFYLVNLLTGFIETERLYTLQPDGTVAEEPLALILLRAFAAEQRTRSKQLRRLGDTALFVSGFFGDSLARSRVDVDYYIAMGERAYGALAETERRLPYDELAERFGAFVDLFAEIAELSDLHSNRGLIRLYERFLHTGSERVAQRLRERGLSLPTAEPSARRAKGLLQ